jgi:acetolactate synthase-1/2/3 large subunit
VKLAEAYGLCRPALRDPEQVDAVIEKAMSINDAPVVIDFVVHEDAMVWPMVPAGLSNDEILAARGQRPDEGDEDEGE